MSMRRSSALPWWVTPVACLAVGAVIAAVHLAGGDGGDAGRSFALMAVIAAVLTVGGRSEAVRVVRGDGRDERTAQIDARAASLVALVLVAALVAMTLYEWSGGRSGSPYVQLVGLGAATYLGGLLWVRRRM
jgi:hypothetical protein